MTFWGGAGMGVVRDSISQIRKLQIDGARDGLWNALTNVLNVSNDQIPHEEGFLEADGEIGLAPGTQLKGGVGYGTSADVKDYAVVQHEDMSLSHDAGRNAKFLENAFNSTREQSLEIIRAAIKRRLNG